MKKDTKNRFLIGIIVLCGLFVSACNQKSTPEDEKFSPQIHFSAEKNWTGEPTGLLYFEGEYHLFYQYNPTQAVFGNIHWGHAVSRDLIHWEKLPVALSPDNKGQVYSGSVIVDTQNTSGFGSKENPAFIAFFTYHKPENVKEKDAEHTIQIAYSLDKGRTWTKQEKPVLTDKKHPVFRNPNVTWNELTNQWLMTVSTGTTIQFYASTNCFDWSFLSEFGESVETDGGWEASNLFPLKINESDSMKWVLLVNMSGGPADGAPGIRYFVGSFDGATFRMTQGQKLWADYGKDNYGGTIFNNTPDNRKIMLGWMNCWEYANLTPAQSWRGSMTFPRKLQLVPEKNDFLLTSNPVKELTQLYGESDSIGEIKLSGEKRIFEEKPFPPAPFVFQLTFDNAGRHAIWGARDYGIRFKTKSGAYLSIGYKAELNYFYIDRSHLQVKPFSESYGKPTGAIFTHDKPTTDWCILVDNNSVELFTCGGRVAMTAQVYPDDQFDSFELYSESGNITLLKASIIVLKHASKGTIQDKK